MRVRRNQPPAGEADVKNRDGFTLTEMLVVILIIGILIGFLMPALTKMRQYAWRARARDSVHQVVAAWKTYLNDYRKFPDGTVIIEMDTNAVGILGTRGRKQNERYLYMEFRTAEQTNGFRDPWGELYQVALDNGMGGLERDSTGPYDGIVTPPHAPGGVGKSVAVWSKGFNNGLEGRPDDPADDITSW